MEPLYLHARGARSGRPLAPRRPSGCRLHSAASRDLPPSPRSGGCEAPACCAAHGAEAKRRPGSAFACGSHRACRGEDFKVVVVLSCRIDRVVFEAKTTRTIQQKRRRQTPHPFSSAVRLQPPVIHPVNLSEALSPLFAELHRTSKVNDPQLKTNGIHLSPSAVMESAADEEALSTPAPKTKTKRSQGKSLGK